MLMLAATATGCGAPTAQSNARTAASAVSPAASPTASPLFAFPTASGITCPDLSTLGLQRTVLDSLDANRRDVVLCDVRDRSHPRLLAVMEGSTAQTFLRQDLLGYISLKGSPSSTPDQYTSVVSTLNLATGQSADLASSPGLALAGGWSPDASTFAYLIDSPDAHSFWIKRGAATAVPLRTPVSVLGRGGIADDEALMSFSADAQYLVVVDTAVNLLQVFRSSDGAPLYSAPSGGTGGLRTMAVWAHQADRLYFRNNSGVYQWDPAGGAATFLPGLRWFNPSLTADDRFVAYGVGMATTPHVELRDLSSGSTVSSPPWRAYPMLLSPTTMLVGQEAPCDSCMGPVNSTGKTLLFRADTRAESDLGITGWTVGPIWPHA